MRKLFVVLAALAVLSLAFGATAFAGGGGEKAASGKKLNFVFVTPLVAHPVWDVARDGFETAAKDMGLRPVRRAPGH